MRSIGAQVVELRPAVDVRQAARAVRKAHVALQDAERAESQAAEVHGQKADEAARRRLELGRELILARKAWPARGPNAKGWGDFLRDAGIDDATARRYMALAGYAEEVSLTDDRVSETVPTYREAGIDRRERKAEAENDDSDPVEHEPDIEEDIDPKHYEKAFLLRADQAIRFAHYSGPVNKNTIDMARRTANAWAKLVTNMERSL